MSTTTSDIINYSVTRLVKNSAGKPVRTLSVLSIPASFKLTFGPGPTKRDQSYDPHTGWGNMLRIYDGKLQRGVITNVVEWISSDITLVNTSMEVAPDPAPINLVMSQF